MVFSVLLSDSGVSNDGGESFSCSRAEHVMPRPNGIVVADESEMQVSAFRVTEALPGSVASGQAIRCLLLAEPTEAGVEATKSLVMGSKLVVEEIVTASSLAKAINFINVHNIDVILLDLDLEDSKSVDTLRALRAVSNAAIIVMSSEDDEVLGVATLREGADDFVVRSQLTNESLRRAVVHSRARRAVREGISEGLEETRHAESRFGPFKEANKMNEAMFAGAGMLITAVIAAAVNAWKGKKETDSAAMKSTSDISINEVQVAAKMYREIINDLKSDYQTLNTGQTKLEEAYMTVREENASLKAENRSLKSENAAMKAADFRANLAQSDCGRRNPSGTIDLRGTTG